MTLKASRHAAPPLPSVSAIRFTQDASQAQHDASDKWQKVQTQPLSPRFRQSQAVLGEVVAVIVAGLVGVLTVQLAKAAGCRVIAIDRDLPRVDQARQFGADLALGATDRDTPSRVKEFARYGADVAIITAASPSAEPIELAASISRDRGRIVVVGTVDLGVSRKPMYMKELSLVLSRSYGPGRYDAQYEEDGLDYPVGYVRWTEKRNMEAFLDWWLRVRSTFRLFSSAVVLWSREARRMRS
jgi:NADPH:quinone reductase-like Zn-dependent oxidoreductase